MNNHPSSSAVVTVAVVGASGYAGAELLRYLSEHPAVEVAVAAAASRAGELPGDLFPNLARAYPAPYSPTDWEAIGESAELVFVSLPHGLSQEPVRRLLDSGVKVIDLGADFRFGDAAEYRAAYQAEHAAPELLTEAVYGLSELNKNAISGARLVANPGCYPTASLLALLPLLQHRGGALLMGPVIIDAKSGVSGAGRTPSVAQLFCEVNETVSAYKVGCHRHQPEIQQFCPQPVVFTPHLVPMTRGLLATVYASHEPCDPCELLGLYREYYGGSPSVELLEDRLPTTKAVAGTHLAQVAVRPSGVPGTSVLLCAIDNLGRGAAGSAVANMNLMLGFDELLGLSRTAQYP